MFNQALDYPLVSPSRMKRYMHPVDFGRAMAHVYDGKPVYFMQSSEEPHLSILLPPKRVLSRVEIPRHKVGLRNPSESYFVLHMRDYLASTFYLPRGVESIDQVREREGKYDFIFYHDSYWHEIAYIGLYDEFVLRSLDHSPISSITPEELEAFIRDGSHIIPKPHLLA